MNRKSLFTFIFAVLIICSLAAYSDNSTETSKNDQGNRQNQQSNDQPMDNQANGEAGSDEGEMNEKEEAESISDLPGSREIVTLVEGMESVRQGLLEKADGYFLYVLPGFVFKDNVLSFVHDDRYQVRIELLGKEVDLGALRKDAEVALKQVGAVEELKPRFEADNPYYPMAKFFLHASDGKVNKIIMVVQVDGTYFKYTFNIPHGEAAEGVYPSMLAMLKTVGRLTN